jgi:hypothetical protein
MVVPVFMKVVRSWLIASVLSDRTIKIIRYFHRFGNIVEFPDRPPHFLKGCWPNNRFGP